MNKEQGGKHSKIGRHMPLRVELGELAYPLQKTNTEMNSRGQVYSYERKLVLPLPVHTEVKDVVFNCRLRRAASDGLSIAALSRERGYIVTAEDVDLEKRTAKLQEHLNVYEDPYSSNNPSEFRFEVTINNEDLVRNRLLVDDKNNFEYHPDLLSTLNSLRMLVSAGGEYMSLGEDLDKEEWSYVDFFPLETGPLAGNSDSTYYFYADNGNHNLTVSNGNPLRFLAPQRSKIGVEFFLNPSSLLR